MTTGAPMLTVATPLASGAPATRAIGPEVKLPRVALQIVPANPPVGGPLIFRKEPAAVSLGHKLESPVATVRFKVPSGVRVFVGVRVGVFVGNGVLVGVLEGVLVGVEVGVEVGVSVGVPVLVGVSVAGTVPVGVIVTVGVCVGVGVTVGV